MQCNVYGSVLVLRCDTLSPNHEILNRNYPRATRCGRDIVTLLWFRPSVRVHQSVRASRLDL